VNVAVPFAETLTENAPPESAVTVCATESLFTTVMVAPGATAVGAVKAKPEIVITFEAGETVPPPVVLGDIEGIEPELDGCVVPLVVEFEQAAAPASAKTVTAAPNMREDRFMLWTRMRGRFGSAERKGEPSRFSSVAASTEVLDEAALRLLYAEHSGPVLAYLLKLTRDRPRAEDLLQETMLRAWRRPAVFEPGRGSVRAWLCTVARNLVIDDIRSRSARPTETELSERTERTESSATADDPYEAALRAWEVADALATLTADHRAVLIEVYYRGATVAEAAQKLGIPPGTAKSRTFYALRALRLACQERGITQ
jgi:RNA polymerase sigma-70 factor (ECF subfamily)